MENDLTVGVTLYEDERTDDIPEPPDPPGETVPRSSAAKEDKGNDEYEIDFNETVSKDPVIIAQLETIATTKPVSQLEIALSETLKRKQAHIDRIMNEIKKLQKFVKKRKQTYKRKRKVDGAPVRAMSAYNLFIKERFAQLAKENEEALKSDDADAAMRRVPPASLIAKTGNEWKTLPPEVKAKYEERYVHKFLQSFCDVDHFLFPEPKPTRSATMTKWPSTSLRTKS